MHQKKRSTFSLIFLQVFYPYMTITFNLIFMMMFAVVGVCIDKIFEIERLAISIQGMLYFGLLYFNYHLAKVPAESAIDLFKRFNFKYYKPCSYLLVLGEYLIIAFGLNFIFSRPNFEMYDIKLIQLLVPCISLALVSTNRVFTEHDKKKTT